MIKHDATVPACSSLVLGFVSSRASPGHIYPLTSSGGRRMNMLGANLFRNWIVSAINIGLFMFVALSLEYRQLLAFLMLDIKMMRKLLGLVSMGFYQSIRVSWVLIMLMCHR
jgi:hypothetical protein